MHWSGRNLVWLNGLEAKSNVCMYMHSLPRFVRRATLSTVSTWFNLKCIHDG